MSKVITATIVTNAVIEKNYCLEDESVNLAAFIYDCVHKDYGHEIDIKGIDSSNGNPRMMFPDYYDDPQLRTWSEVYPYIIRNNKVEWDVPFDEVTVEDFITTHKIKENDPIRVNIGGGIGGLGGDFFQFVDWLSVIVPAFDALKDNLDLIAATLTITQAFKGRNGLVVNPREARDYFRSREQWKEQELIDEAGLSSNYEIAGIMDYSEFKKDKDNTYVRQTCSLEKHEDNVALNNQAIWGQYDYNGIIDDIAARLHDANKAITEILLISQEIGSDSYEIVTEFVDEFRNNWTSTIRKGNHFQFLQLIPDAEPEDIEQLEDDLDSLIEALNVVLSYLTRRLEPNELK